MIDPQLPHDVEIENRLLSAAMVALPETRAEILAATTRSDFFDDWNRWVYDALVSGHGLDAGKLIQHVYARRESQLLTKENTPGYSDAELERINAHWGPLGFWLGRLLVDWDDSSLAGRVDDWRTYAADLRKMTDRRLRILQLLTELEELCG